MHEAPDDIAQWPSPKLLHRFMTTEDGPERNIYGAELNRRRLEEKRRKEAAAANAAKVEPEYDPDELSPAELVENGAALLDEIELFLSRFIAYPSEAARVAHTLWIAHTHRMDVWDSTPRIAFLSPEPGSGKSRALEVTELLVPRPVHAVNTSSAYLFRKVDDAAGKPTILYDEIDTVFGPRAKENEDIRGMLNSGHRKGAKAGRCVVRGNAVGTEEFESYCAVALAGLDDLPDTIMSRSVVVRMRRRAPYEAVEPFRVRLHGSRGHALRDALAKWAMTIPDEVWPDFPPEITDRNADVYEALFAVADQAGGHWPDRARGTAVTAVTAKSQDKRSMGIMLLEDLKTVFGDKEQLYTEDILTGLTSLPETIWDDIRGKPLDASGLAQRLGKYQVKSGNVRIDGKQRKGYSRGDLVDVWARYVTAEEAGDIQSSKRIPTNSVGIEPPSHPPSDSGVTAVPPSQDEYVYEDSDFLCDEDPYQSEDEAIAMLERVFSRSDT